MKGGGELQERCSCGGFTERGKVGIRGGEKEVMGMMLKVVMAKELVLVIVMMVMLMDMKMGEKTKNR